jgi:hypothetical protein
MYTLLTLTDDCSAGTGPGCRRIFKPIRQTTGSRVLPRCAAARERRRRSTTQPGVRPEFREGRTLGQETRTDPNPNGVSQLEGHNRTKVCVTPAA